VIELECPSPIRWRTAPRHPGRPSLRAIGAGQRMTKSSTWCARFARTDGDTPVVLMATTIPIYVYGVTASWLTPGKRLSTASSWFDLPPEEEEDALPAGARDGLQFHPTWRRDDRRRRCGRARQASGFVTPSRSRITGCGGARCAAGRTRRWRASSA